MADNWDLRAAGALSIILGPIVLGAIFLGVGRLVEGWVFVAIGVAFGLIVLLGSLFGKGRGGT